RYHGCSRQPVRAALRAAARRAPDRRDPISGRARRGRARATEIDPAYKGLGLGTRLVEGALRDLRKRRARVIPICPLVAGYIRRHPEYADLVADDRASLAGTYQMGIRSVERETLRIEQARGLA